MSTPELESINQKISMSFALLRKRPGESVVDQKNRQRELLHDENSQSSMDEIFNQFHGMLQILPQNSDQRKALIRRMEYCYLSLFEAYSAAPKDELNEAYGSIMMQIKAAFAPIFNDTVARAAAPAAFFLPAIAIVEEADANQEFRVAFDR